MSAAAQQGGKQQREKSSWQLFLDKVKQEDATWEKAELLNVLYWVKQIVGLLAGLIWGAVPITGISGIVLFLGLCTVSCVAFYKSVLGVDEEEFGGHWELLNDGFHISVATFLLAWITVYSTVHT